MTLTLVHFRLLALELPALEGPIDFGKCCPDDSNVIFDRNFIRLAGNEDSQNILEEFEFGSDRTIHMRVTSSLVPHRHIMGKMLSGRLQLHS